jgi:flagellar assembly protein FliH
MAAPARFLFDLDFAAPAQAAKPVEATPEPVIPTVPLADHMAALEAARLEADEEGYARGRADGEVRAADRLADEAGRLVASARALLAALEADSDRIEKEAIDLAVAVARKLAATLVDREPLAEIRALVAECLGPLRKAPHIVIRLGEADAEALRPHVDRLARETGFEGKIVILGEPDVKRGDCRIEWADGGIVRDGPALDALIDDAVARFVEARTGEGAVHTDPVASRRD